MCANGPTLAPVEMCDSLITQKLLMTTRSSIRESTIRTPELTTQPSPIVVRPSR
jgi:hypothetical protein